MKSVKVNMTATFIPHFPNLKHLSFSAVTDLRK